MLYRTSLLQQEIQFSNKAPKTNAKNILFNSNYARSPIQALEKVRDTIREYVTII